MKILWTSAIAVTVFFTGTFSTNAAVFTLYNGSGLPASQGSLKPGALQSSGVPTSVSETLVSGGVQLNTAANSVEYSGYSNYDPSNSTYFKPATFNASTLNQNTGYTLTFTVNPTTVVDTPTRAAFSVIAISSDKKGIEIGFKAASIFAQSASFGTAAQTAAFTTNTTETYVLTVFNDSYSLLLSSGGSPIINGALQTYNFDPINSQPPLPFNPYTTGSFLFFGDNTGQASGTFTLGSVTLDTTPIPFEFSPTYGLLAIGTGLAIRNWRKKAKDKIK